MVVATAYGAPLLAAVYPAGALHGVTVTIGATLKDLLNVTMQVCPPTPKVTIPAISVAFKSPQFVPLIDGAVVCCACKWPSLIANRALEAGVVVPMPTFFEEFITKAGAVSLYEVPIAKLPPKEPLESNPIEKAVDPFVLKFKTAGAAQSFPNLLKLAWTPGPPAELRAMTSKKLPVVSGVPTRKVAFVTAVGATT